MLCFGPTVSLHEDVVSSLFLFFPQFEVTIVRFLEI